MVIVAHSIVQTKHVAKRKECSMKLDNIDSQALTAAGSLLKYSGLRNLGRLPSPILQDLVEEPRQLERLRTMCLWDAMVATLNLKTFLGRFSKDANLPAKLSDGGVNIGPIASRIINNSSSLSEVKSVILCVCSVFQLTGHEFGASMTELIEALKEVRVGDLRGQKAPVELLWEIACNPPLIGVTTATFPIMEPVQYELGEFGLLEVVWQQRGIVISPKLDYQASIPGHHKVMFILENVE
jgi:hypothetical protein